MLSEQPDDGSQVRLGPRPAKNVRHSSWQVVDTLVMLLYVLAGIAVAAALVVRGTGTDGWCYVAGICLGAIGVGVKRRMERRGERRRDRDEP